jgi:carboxyl-terminal processing protease
MKLQFLTCLLLSFCFVQAQSKKTTLILNEIIETMEAHSLHSKEVDWEILTKEAHRLAKGATRTEELGNSIRFLFQSLDDFHGVFKYKDSTFHWQKAKVSRSEVLKKALDQKGNKFFTSTIGNVGYLRIPTTLQDIAKERSQTLQDSLCKILNKELKGLIFDLRLNGGGNIFSMVTGISNILNYGPVTPTDEIRKDGYYRDSVNIHLFKETCKRNHLTIPIVILTGPFTASSAEMLAIILKNRPNTILIGEPTAGYITGVAGFRIARNAHINLAVSYMTDVTGKEYKSKIQPDVLIEGGDNFTDLSKDEKIIAAIKWLKEFQER